MKNQNLNILDAAKKKKFIEKVSYLGIKKFPYLLMQTGRERIVAYSGSFSREEISKLCQFLSVEGIGLYFAKDTDEGIRMSLDALHTIKEEVRTGIVELNEKQEKEWFLGKNIELDEKQEEKYKELEGFVAIKSGEDFIGTGRKRGKVINNFLPKERRVKS